MCSSSTIPLPAAIENALPSVVDTMHPDKAVVNIFAPHIAAFSARSREGKTPLRAIPADTTRNSGWTACRKALEFEVEDP